MRYLRDIALSVISNFIVNVAAQIILTLVGVAAPLVIAYLTGYAKTLPTQAINLVLIISGLWLVSGLGTILIFSVYRSRWLKRFRIAMSIVPKDIAINEAIKRSHDFPCNQDIQKEINESFEVILEAVLSLVAFGFSSEQKIVTIFKFDDTAAPDKPCFKVYMRRPTGAYDGHERSIDHNIEQILTLSNSFAGSAIQESKLLTIPDHRISHYTDTNRWHLLESDSGFVSHAAIPIRSLSEVHPGKTLGVLCVDIKRRWYYGKEDGQTLGVAADKIAALMTLCDSGDQKPPAGSKTRNKNKS